jgi:hypothetical protein
MLRESALGLLSSIFIAAADADDAAAAAKASGPSGRQSSKSDSKARMTVGSQFKNSLERLMVSVSCCCCCLLLMVMMMMMMVVVVVVVGVVVVVMMMMMVVVVSLLLCCCRYCACVVCCQAGRFPSRSRAFSPTITIYPPPPPSPLLSPNGLIIGHAQRDRASLHSVHQAQRRQGRVCVRPSALRRAAARVRCSRDGAHLSCRVPLTLGVRGLFITVSESKARERIANKG